MPHDEESGLALVDEKDYGMRLSSSLPINTHGASGSSTKTRNIQPRQQHRRRSTFPSAANRYRPRFDKPAPLRSWDETIKPRGKSSKRCNKRGKPTARSKPCRAYYEAYLPPDFIQASFRQNWYTPELIRGV